MSHPPFAAKTLTQESRTSLRTVLPPRTVTHPTPLTKTGLNGDLIQEDAFLTSLTPTTHPPPLTTTLAETDVELPFDLASSISADAGILADGVEDGFSGIYLKAVFLIERGVLDDGVEDDFSSIYLGDSGIEDNFIGILAVSGCG